LAAVILKPGVAERLWKDLTDNIDCLETESDDAAPDDGLRRVQP
jgi:hypothetical protein